jgi:hypothetical protein
MRGAYTSDTCDTCPQPRAGISQGVGAARKVNMARSMCVICAMCARGATGTPRTAARPHRVRWPGHGGAGDLRGASDARCTALAAGNKGAQTAQTRHTPHARAPAARSYTAAGYWECHAGQDGGSRGLR